MRILEQDEKHFILIHRTADSLFSLIADGQYRNTTLGRETWKSLLGSEGSLQLNCNMEEFNVFGGSCGAKARIGIIANNEIGCGYSPDSTIGFGIGGGDLAVSNSTGGNAAAYGQQADNGGRDLKAMGYILVHWPGGGGGTQQVFIPKGSAPKVQPLTLLWTIFHEKGTPFVNLLLTNSTPFTYLV